MSENKVLKFKLYTLQHKDDKYYTFSYNAICRIHFIVSSYKLHRRIQVYYWYKKRVIINILNF